MKQLTHRKPRTSCLAMLDADNGNITQSSTRFRGSYLHYDVTSIQHSLAFRRVCCVMAYRRRLKKNRPPDGWDMIENVIEDFENQMKEAVNEEHEGKRRTELNYKIHRIHWEKNRFIYDLMYQRRVMSKELVNRHVLLLAFIGYCSLIIWSERRLLMEH